MTKKTFINLLALGVALTIALAFAGGWLAAEFYAQANPPGFEILQDYRDEVALIRLTKFDGQFLEGSYEGDQPRFLLGEKEELVIPEKDKGFRLDLSHLKNN